MNLRQTYINWQESTRAIVTQLLAAFPGNRMALGVDTVDDMIVDLTTKGVVLKSPNGHYWRFDVDNAGSLGSTDLGTVKP